MFEQDDTSDGPSRPSAASLADLIDAELRRVPLEWDLDDDFAALLDDTEVLLADSMLGLQAAQLDQQLAEAARVRQLLVAYDAAVADAALIGSELGGDPVRDGRLDRAFLLQASRALRMSERGAAHLVHVADSCRRSMPACWAVFQQGRCPWNALDIAHRAANGLSGEPLAEFDAAVAPPLAVLGTSELRRRAHRLRERMQARTADEARDRAACERRVVFAPLPDGQASLTLVGPAPDLAAIDAALTSRAVELHGDAAEPRGIGALRLDVAVDLLIEGVQCDADPARAAADGHRLLVPKRRGVQPTVLVTIPAATLGAALSAEIAAARKAATGATAGAGANATVGPSTDSPTTDAESPAPVQQPEPAILAGYGPIDLHTAKALARAAKSWTRVLTDPITGGLIDIDPRAKRIPKALQKWLGARDEICRAPGCTRPASGCDIDHTVRREHGGATTADNLAMLCRRHHQTKDDGWWRVTLEPDATMHWRSRWATEHITRPAIGAAPPIESWWTSGEAVSGALGPAALRTSDSPPF